jgi:hypothetical protein
LISIQSTAFSDYNAGVIHTGPSTVLFIAYDAHLMTFQFSLVGSDSSTHLKSFAPSEKIENRPRFPTIRFSSFPTANV